MKDIMVSVCCITYNHEKYIKEAIDSFLNQKTNFKFEIIINDDASTDNTADIIKEYENRYPDIIKPIYQKENQFSKGIKASSIVMNKAKGKYIALCEGDDYWCNENKLQMQVDYLEKNPECSFCFHDAKILNTQNGKFNSWKNTNKKYKKKNNIYNAGELELYDFIPTASFMFRTENVNKIPDWYQKAVVGDKALKLIMTSFGYAYCIDKVMSVYRRGTGNSATDLFNVNNKEKEKAINHFNKIKLIIDEFNEFSNYKYDKELQISKLYMDINILNVKENYQEIISNEKYKKILTPKQYLKYKLKIHFPKVFLGLKKFKNRILKNYRVR